jgi:DNA polymerase III subunit epsilon
VLHRAEHTDKENVLIHGISPTDMREGVASADALLNFLEFVGKSPWWRTMRPSIAECWAGR